MRLVCPVCKWQYSIKKVAPPLATNGSAIGAVACCFLFVVAPGVIITLMDAFEILVIILSITLAVFLALAIAALVYILKVVKMAKEITEKASSAVDNVSNVAMNVGKFVTPAAAGKMLVDIIQRFASRSGNKKSKED